MIEADNTLKRSSLLTTKYTIENMFSLHDSIYLNTKYTVLRVDAFGDVLQTLPVRGERRLAAMTVGGMTHCEVFSDRLFETTTLEQRMPLFSLSLGKVKKAGQMQVKLPHVAIILDGLPRVFQLSGNWYQSPSLAKKVDTQQ